MNSTKKNQSLPDLFKKKNEIELELQHSVYKNNLREIKDPSKLKIDRKNFARLLTKINNIKQGAHCE
eukprot:COSAG01_NODE_1_length_100484_cov_170.446142_83_plen_67_part_00